MLDENGQTEEIIENYSELVADEYHGQAAVAVGAGIAIGTLVTVLLKVTATVIIAGFLFTAAPKAIEKIKSDTMLRIEMVHMFYMGIL